MKAPPTAEKIMMEGRIVTVTNNTTSIRTIEYAKEIYLELFAGRVKLMLKEKMARKEKQNQ